MKRILFFVVLILLNSSAFTHVTHLEKPVVIETGKRNTGTSSNSMTTKSEERKLWLITAKISYNSTYRRDTTGSFDAGGKQWEKEFHQSGKTNAIGFITAIVENQAGNPAKDFLYHSDSGDPVSITVTGNGSNSESGNSRETIDGVLISADIRTDNVSGSAYPSASLYFDYSDENKVFSVGMGIKAVGSYSGRMYSGGIGSGEWKDYGGNYDDYGISCGGGGDALSEKNCKMSKSGNGYQGSWKESESKQRHTASGPEFTTSETTVEITVMPYKESDKPVVTMEGCKDLGVSETGTITATAKPVGGSFKFWVEPSDLMAVSSHGNTASVTGKTPGKGVIMVEYTTPDGKTAQTSQAASCAKIEKYNGGQPIPQIALYDIDGKKLTGIKTVPVDAQPADASELVKFEPADQGVVTAVGVGNEVILQGLRLGRTTLQAKTKCGETTGPAVEVEVVNCDDETIATLERLRETAMKSLQEANDELKRISGSKEYEDAKENIVKSFEEMMLKAGLTIVTSGKASGVQKVAVEIVDKGNALREIITSNNPEELKNNVGKFATGEAFEKYVKNQFGELVEGLWGKSVSAAIGVLETQEAAQKFGDNWSKTIQYNREVKLALERFENADKDLQKYIRLQQKCKGEKPAPQKNEAPKDEPKPEATKPKPPVKPTPKSETPPAQPPQNDQSTPEQPTPEDEILVDPERPPIPPRQVGLPYEPGKCGCDSSKNLTASSNDFSTLDKGLKNLGECVENFTSTSLSDYQGTLQELSTITSSMSELLKTDAAAFLTKAMESKPKLDTLVTRISAYDKAGNAFLKSMEKCPESLTSGMEIFQSVEKITIDSIKTKY